MQKNRKFLEEFKSFEKNKNSKDSKSLKKTLNDSEFLETSTELKKKEEKLNEQEEIMNKKLKELEETNKIFKNKEKYLASFRKKVEDDCA